MEKYKDDGIVELDIDEEIDNKTATIKRKDYYFDENDELKDDHYFLDKSDEQKAKDYFLDNDDSNISLSKKSKVLKRTKKKSKMSMKQKVLNEEIRRQHVDEFFDEEDEEKLFKEDKKKNTNTVADDLLEETHTKHKMNSGLKVLIVILSIFAFIYIAGVITFNYIFEFGTTINGIKVRFKTPQQVAESIENDADVYNFTIIERDGKTDSILGKDIAISYDKNINLEDLLQEQNPFDWPISLIPRFNSNLSVNYDYDNAKLKKIVENFEFMQDDKMIKPEDAKVVYDKDKKEFVVKKEVLGTTVDKEKVYKEISKAISHAQENVNLEKEECYKKPKVLSDDEELKKSINKFNELCNKSIIYQMGDKTKVLDGETVVQWLKTDDEGKTTFNDDSIKGWLKEFGQEFDTVGKSRTFTSADGATYQVSGGTYGWELDEEAEFNEIKKLLSEGGENQTREPICVQKGKAFVQDGQAEWGNTYAEVNLTTQHMYYVKDGQIVFSTDIISGLPTPKKETPCGVYSCLEKKQNKVLKGEIQANGKPEYETPVAYWMRITWTGVGFHTATWQSHFGGNTYTYNGSHGCINMSYSDSQTLYGIIQVGDPIIIHK